MKKYLIATFALAMLAVSSVSFVALAQSASPAPVVASAPAVVIPANQSALQILFAAHGGVLATLLLFVISFNTLMSAVRQILYKWDGVNPGDAIPADDKALTTANKICLLLGKITDFATGNTQH